MPLVNWTRNILEPQGYVVTENIIYQDNKSTILLKNNGKSSISKRTKHINIRFFVTDSIHKVDMSVECCLTGEITRYFLTKPNQGYIFKIFKDLIMVVMPQTYPSNVKQGNRTKKSN